MTTPREILKHRLQEALAAIGMSPTKLALEIGKDRNYIRDFYRNKKKSLTAEALADCARVLGVSCDYLVGMLEQQHDGVRQRLVMLYAGDRAQAAYRFEET